jgi:proteic killer suppression protein
MIKSFRHKGLQKFFETGKVTGIQPEHKQKLRLRLIALDTAFCIEDMDTPGWRLVFKFEDGNAYLVDYEDYH